MKVNLDLSLKGRVKFVAPARQERAFHKGIITWIKVLKRVASIGESVKKPRIMSVIDCYYLRNSVCPKLHRSRNIFAP